MQARQAHEFSQERKQACQNGPRVAAQTWRVQQFGQIKGFVIAPGFGKGRIDIGTDRNCSLLQASGKSSTSSEWAASTSHQRIDLKLTFT